MVRFSSVSYNDLRSRNIFYLSVLTIYHLSQPLLAIHRYLPRRHHTRLRTSPSRALRDLVLIFSARTKVVILTFFRGTRSILGSSESPARHGLNMTQYLAVS